MTTLDRYLLRRFWHVFAISFIALFGLYVVIDAFTNADEFLDKQGGTLVALKYMAEFYAYRVSQFFDLIGGTVAIIAAMVVFSLVQRYGELNPVLSAGVPTFRLAVPVLWGVVLVQVALVTNQEVIIPRIANQFNVRAGSGGIVRNEVEPAYDHLTGLLITGKNLDLKQKKLQQAAFVLSTSLMVREPTSVNVVEASYQDARADFPAGWVLKGVSPQYPQLPLTEKGKEYVRPLEKPDELFIVTDVSFDLIYKRDKNIDYLSTADLMRRIKSPSQGSVSIRKQSLHLHARVTRPIVSLIAVLLGIPLMVRKESTGLVVNMALCALAMAALFGLQHLFLYLGRVNLLSPDLSVWIPIIISGATAAWLSSWVRT